VSTAGRVLKRLLVGQPFTNDKLGDTLLPKRIALPVFASDALSSVADAPVDILINAVGYKQMTLPTKERV
jgi:hypothetical protein